MTSRPRQPSDLAERGRWSGYGRHGPPCEADCRPVLDTSSPYGGGVTLIRRMLMLSGLFVVLFASAAHAQYVPGEPGIIVDPGTVEVGGTIEVQGTGLPRATPRSRSTSATSSSPRPPPADDGTGSFDVKDIVLPRLDRPRQLHGPRLLRRSRPHRRAQRHGRRHHHAARGTVLPVTGSDTGHLRQGRPRRSSRSVACSCSAPAAAEPRSSRPAPGVPATATHYEILGVSPDAGHDEVKRAYTQQAFGWHPDRRRRARRRRARAQADWRMRECNAAWAVLGTPAGRAAYDERAPPRRPAAGPAGRAGREPRPRRCRRGQAGVPAAPSVGRVPSPTDQLVEPSRDFGIMAREAPHRPLGGARRAGRAGGARGDRGRRRLPGPDSRHRPTPSCAPTPSRSGRAWWSCPARR